MNLFVFCIGIVVVLIALRVSWKHRKFKDRSTVHLLLAAFAANDLLNVIVGLAFTTNAALNTIEGGTGAGVNDMPETLANILRLLIYLPSAAVFLFADTLVQHQARDVERCNEVKDRIVSYLKDSDRGSGRTQE